MSPEENERLTRVGPSTPVGDVMRRYWWPVWFSDTVGNKPVPVRLLGEDLILFRDGNGKTGLLDRHCPHRGASLELGRVESDGIRCCYHGWKFDGQGRCLDMPAEPANSALVREVKQKAYPTEEAGGLVFAYLGPKPVPKLPRYDLLYRPGLERTVGASEEYCNWMQRAENAVDQMHSTALHATVYPEIALQRPTCTWQQDWYGVHAAFEVPGKHTKHSYFLFPSHSRYFGARVNDLPSHILRFRVPVDDVTTRTFFIRAREARGEPEGIVNNGLVKSERGVYARIEDGWWGLTSREQDRAAQESQGLIANRSRETLATSDLGVVMFRKMLTQAIAAVENGEDPPGVVRQDSNDLIVFDTRKVREGKEMVA